MTTTTRRYGHYYDGKEQPGQGGHIPRRSPATGHLVAEFAEGTADDARAAIAAARAAFDDGPWPRLAPQERSRHLYRLAELVRRDRDRLARIDAEEVGKPIRQARGDIDGAIGLLEFAAGAAQHVHGDAHTLGHDFSAMVVREPVGVAGLVIPWNFPGLILCQKLPFALAAGCTAVVKPSELTSGSALEIAALAGEAGIPPGVVNVVTGYGPIVGQEIVESPDVDLVSFTGSTRTGRQVMRTAAERVKPIHLELGGKAANIVFADADLEAAAEATLFAVYFNQGECCVSGSRLLVEDSVADEFVYRVATRAEQLRVGQPLDEATDVGALIHEGHLEKVLGYIAAGTADGATLVTGGQRLGDDAHPAGNFVAPTIFDHVGPSMRIFQEEIFGPVLSVTRFSDATEAIRLANDTEYGLAGAVWTTNVDTAMTVSKALRCGTVWINTQIDGAPQLPFGGVKSSGFGKEMGMEGVLEFTELKTIQIRTGKRPPFFQPPDAQTL